MVYQSHWRNRSKENVCPHIHVNNIQAGFVLLGLEPLLPIVCRQRLDG